MGIVDREQRQRIHVLPHFVYVLIDPRNGHPKYVGLSHDVEARYKTHVARSTKTTKEWITELKSLGLRPWLQVAMPVKNWFYGQRHEADCIYQLGLAYPLLNIARGVKEVQAREASIAAMQERRLTYLLFQRMRCQIRASVFHKLPQHACNLARPITFNGITKSIGSWAKTIGITRNALHLRLKKHSVDVALTMPRQGHRKAS